MFHGYYVKSQYNDDRTILRTTNSSDTIKHGTPSDESPNRIEKLLFLIFGSTTLLIEFSFVANLGEVPYCTVAAVVFFSFFFSCCEL